MKSITIFHPLLRTSSLEHKFDGEHEVVCLCKSKRFGMSIFEHEHTLERE
jgi:hypothetical protein